jgi:hypothetical protein
VSNRGIDELSSRAVLLLGRRLGRRGFIGRIARTAAIAALSIAGAGSVFVGGEMRALANNVYCVGCATGCLPGPNCPSCQYSVHDLDTDTWYTDWCGWCCSGYCLVYVASGPNSCGSCPCVVSSPC